MANQGGAIARFLVKWLVIPVGLAAVGFFLIGPRIAARGRAEAKAATSPSPVADVAETPKIIGDPEVTIRSTPVNRRRAPRRRPSRREEASPVPAREETRPTEPPSPDEAPPARSGDG